MPVCDQCGTESSPEARFCRNCGAALGSSESKRLPTRDLRRGSGASAADWYTLDDVLYTRDKRLGGIGALLVFFGAFCPWAASETYFFGLHVGSQGVNSPQAWLIALAGIGAAVLLFRRRGGSPVMVIGIVVGAWTVLFALTALTGNASPSWGTAITLAGAGMLAYSGHLTNQYERGV